MKTTRCNSTWCRSSFPAKELQSLMTLLVVVISSVCSEGDLKEVVGRLRDWFRVLHENGNHKRLKLQKPEKNSESSRMFFKRTRNHRNRSQSKKKKKNADRSSHSYSRQSSRSGRHPFVRTLSVGCSLAWTPTSTCSLTNRRSRASTWTGTSRAPMPSSSPATFTSTKCSPAPSGARASRDTQVRCASQR